MPLRSLKNRAGEPESTIVSGKEIDFRTSRSAGTPNVDCNLRIWYHMRGSQIGQWWTYWKEKGSTTLNGPLTMNDSVDGNVTTISGQKHGYDHSSWNSVDINLNTYATNTAGKLVVFYKGGGGYRGDAAWAGHLLTCRNGRSLNFDPDLARPTDGPDLWMHYDSPTTWAGAGGSEADARSNYGTFYSASNWQVTDYGSNDPINYDTSDTPSGYTGPDRNHEGWTGEYYIYCEASGNSGNAGLAGFPFFTIHQWRFDYNLQTGALVP